ncbi:endonuclease [Psychromonas aquimarina]|uniref:endonuclease n=1 Tax=Psychromonas aquimarina TaxID=444919 RepID=UPI00040E3F9E|nr:endonuclease [Psychromonas aquimarina]
MMNKSKISMTALCAGLAFNVNADLLISEVLYDAPNNDSVEEFVELFNAGCETVDLSQYKLSDNSGSYNLQGSLASGDYFTVAADQAGFSSLFSTAPDQFPMSLTLGNSGDYVRLSKGSAETDVVAWEGGLSGWSLNVRNVSLYRTTVVNSKSAADWSASSNAGNPGSGSLTTSCDNGGDTGGSEADPAKLENGKAKSNLSAGAGQTLKFTADIPAGATKLSFVMSGGTGDADLYMRQGSEPTTSVSDCAPYLSGNNEQCAVAAPVTGRYYINIEAYESFSGVSLTVNYTAQSGGDNGGETNGDYSYSVYYSDAIGKSGSALKSSLNQIIKGHTRFSYSKVWDGLNYADEDPNNSDNVILLYTGRSEAKTNRAGMSNSSDAWNREHVWAKSHGFPSSGQHGYTDFHHLRPADVSVNSSRGNKDFAAGGSEISEAPGNYTDSNSFEPRDEVKGDVARMVFYMDVRYQGNDSSGTPDLSIADGTTSTGDPQLGDLCTLLSWHLQDPVSDWERRRNNRIFEWQKNRNPFIDNGAWASELYGASCQ